MRGFALVIAGGLIVACTKAPPDDDIAPKCGTVVGRPEWVTRGAGAFGGEKHVLYGVGAKTGIRDRSLLRSAADAHARADISRTFETSSRSMLDEYRPSSAALYALDKPDAEQPVSNFSAATMQGVMIVGHWCDPVDGTMYSLARLDLAGFVDKLEPSKDLSQEVKERVRRTAERAFAELEREEAKMRQREATGEHGGKASGESDDSEDDF